MKENNLDHNPPTVSEMPTGGRREVGRAELHSSLRSEWAPDLYLSFLPEKLRKEVIFTIEQGLRELKKIKWPIQAVVWGGGFKDGEVVYTENKLGSDIDLYIFSNFAPLFWKKIKKFEKKINKKNSISFHFHGVIPLFLPKSRTYWAYRLKNQGVVLKGDKEILNKIQANSNNIPKIEAIRILFWNLALWLNSPSNPQRILRSYLNLGESYLTFAGKLASSFKERVIQFDEVSQQFNLDDELQKKIKLGYKTRMGPLETGLGKDLTLERAKQDCLGAIDHLLSIYLKTNVSLEEKLDILRKEIRPRYLFNLALFYFLKDLKEIKPRFFPIVFRFKITDLWKMVVYSKVGEKEKLFEILKKYFKVQKFSEETLIKIFEAHPTLSTVELV